MEKILLDVGGTFIKCSDGRQIPIDSSGNREEIVASLREAVCTEGAEIASVQLRAAVPGPFDYATGQFLMKHKFAAVYGEYFADIVGLPHENCRFVHDVNCMLLGELCRNGAIPQKEPNTAMIALGTGLGFSMFIDGKILESELGSPAVSIYNRPFRDGVLEDYASKRGVLRLFGDDSITVKEIADLAREGNCKAQQAFARMGSIIGEAVAPIFEEYGVRNLILGGQISRSAGLFIPSIREKLPGILSIRTVSDFDNATFNGLEVL